jgi:membrane peptidoglycan carboxypeptidase
MGYDDNTKLKGVSGGGLPTDIWREVMMRVHEGVPQKPLPMSAPIGATNVLETGPAVPQTNEGIIENLLRDLLGGGGGGSGSNGPAPSGGDR